MISIDQMMNEFAALPNPDWKRRLLRSCRVCDDLVQKKQFLRDIQTTIQAELQRENVSATELFRQAKRYLKAKKRVRINNTFNADLFEFYKYASIPLIAHYLGFDWDSLAFTYFLLNDKDAVFKIAKQHCCAALSEHLVSAYINNIRHKKSRTEKTQSVVVQDLRMLRDAGAYFPKTTCTWLFPNCVILTQPLFSPCGACQSMKHSRIQGCRVFRFLCWLLADVPTCILNEICEYTFYMKLDGGCGVMAA